MRLSTSQIRSATMSRTSNPSINGAGGDLMM